MAVAVRERTPAGDVPARRANSWRLMRGLVGVTAIVAVAWLVVVPQLRSAAGATRTLSAVNPAWLGAAVLAEAAALLAYARLSQHTLSPARIRFAAMLRIDLATLAVGHVTPAGSVVGAGLGYRLLTHSGVSPAKAISAKTVQAVGSAVVLNLLLAVALGAAVARDGTTSLYSTAAVLILAMLGTVAVFAVLLIRHPQRCADWAAALAAVLPGVQPASGARLAASLTEALGLLTHDRRFLTTTAAWATANWLLDAAALWCAVTAFGHPLGPVGLGVAYGLANLFAAIPLTPGGLGIIEGVLLPVLTSFHTPHTDAVLGITTWRLLNFWAPIPIGLAALAITRRTHQPPLTDESAVGVSTNVRGDAVTLTDNRGAPTRPTRLPAGHPTKPVHRVSTDARLIFQRWRVTSPMTATGAAPSLRLAERHEVSLLRRLDKQSGLTCAATSVACRAPGLTAAARAAGGTDSGPKRQRVCSESATKSPRAALHPPDRELGVGRCAAARNTRCATLDGINGDRSYESRSRPPTRRTNAAAERSAMCSPETERHQHCSRNDTDNCRCDSSQAGPPREVQP